MLEVKIRRVRPGVTLPYYASEAAAGLDLSAAITEPLVIHRGERHRIPTGIAIALPSRNWVGLLFARSGLAYRSGLALANGVGVIDADYRGEIMCAVINLGEEPVTVNPGDRIAQLVFMPVAAAKLVEVEQLDETERGAGGFGSTGVKSGGR